MTDAELDALVGAWERGDGEALATAGARLGVALDPAVLAPLEPRLRNQLGRRDVLLTVAAALDAEHGLGVRELKSATPARWVDGKDFCLAVRTESSVVVGVAHAPNQPMTPTHVWSELRPWYRELGRNRKRAEAWAAVADEDRVWLPLVPKTVAAPTGAPDVAALRAEIVAHPDDDRPRLVLADLLTEQGDAHGELITLQIRLAHGELAAAAQEEAQARVKAILAAHGPRIAGEVEERAADYAIVRGFVGAITIAAPTFARHGERLLSTHPITTVTLKPLNAESLAKLAATPSLARVRRLHLRQEIGAERDVPVEPLGRSPHLGGLEELRFDNHQSPPDDWERALAALAAPRLRTLSLSSSSLRGLLGLARNPHLPSLKELVLHPGWSRRPEAFAELDAAIAALSARGSTLGGLEVLRLDSLGGLGAAQLAPLLDGAAPYRLRSLALRSCHVDDAGVEAIVAAAGAQALTSVELSGKRTTDAGVRALLRLPRLERLDAYLYDPLEPPAIERVLAALRALPSSHPLREVDINGVTLPPELAERFTRR